MAERASVLQRVQVGLEATGTPGTAVSAGKQWLVGKIMLDPQTPKVAVPGAGGKFPVSAVQGKGWSQFEMPQCDIAYDELSYILATLVNRVTGGSPYTYFEAPFDSEPVNSLTMEVGSSVRAERIAYGMFDSWSAEFTEARCTHQGKGFGQVMDEGVTMTATPTKLSPACVNPKDWTLLIGTSIGGLAAVTRPLSVRFGIGDANGPAFYGNSDASFSADVERAPSLTAQIVHQRNSATAAWMTALRAGTDYFARILVSGPGSKALQITWAFEWQKDKPGDQDNQYVSVFDVMPKWEATWGKVYEIVNTSGQAGL
jgi:hypothetical protein